MTYIVDTREAIVSALRDGLPAGVDVLDWQDPDNSTESVVLGEMLCDYDADRIAGGARASLTEDWTLTIEVFPTANAYDNKERYARVATLINLVVDGILASSIVAGVSRLQRIVPVSHRIYRNEEEKIVGEVKIECNYRVVRSR